MPEVFLVSCEKGWRLPSFTPPNDIYNTDAQVANRLIEEQLGAGVVTLQALRLVKPLSAGPLNVYVVERREDAEKYEPTVAGSWIGREALPSVSFALPLEQVVVMAWLTEADGEPLPSLGLPWWQEGWFTATADWLRAEVERLGRTPLAPAEQIRSAYTSAILRVLTDAGAVYLKVVPRVFAQEPALTRMLTKRDPAHFPEVLAAAGDRLLLGDLGEYRSLGGSVPLAQWEEIVRFYGRLQAGSVETVEEWLALGCADLRLGTLLDEFEELFARIPERLRGLPQQLSDAERMRLRALAALLKALCQELADYGVPDALEHGDLHAGNVALRAEGFVVYDWSHACVTYPFYGFGALLLDDDWFPERPDTVSRLRDVYLEAWTGYASLPQLREAFARWRRLRSLFAAIHQSHVVAAYQERLQGQDYLLETATGNALQHMQWWLASHWRETIRSFEGV
ncbi:MAG TPA: phosphotransferase [Chthonomonadaceae bacterium]|nr:phosphotransferase [Chthonomonadaceae bacterium]